MTVIHILLGVISITGGLLLGAVLLAFVVAGWINQPPISKQHLAQSSGEGTLASRANPLSNGVTVLERVDTTKKTLEESVGESLGC